MKKRRLLELYTTRYGRSYTRGIPYSPEGTIQDFAASPRHVKLAEIQRNIEVRAGRKPTGLYAGPTITTKDGLRPLVPGMQASTNNAFNPSIQATKRDFEMPQQGQDFQQDIRVDPMYDHLPEHVRSAKQSMVNYQSDAYGESIRGVIPPPPPPGEIPDPRPYTAPKVQLDDLWWVLMACIVISFVFLAKIGR